MKCSASALLVCSLLGCTRASAASFVPKLELSCRLARTREHTLGEARASDRTDVAVAAWLRWQPSIAASSVPERYELSPSAWLAPCALDDASCLAELALDEPELAAALRDAP